MSDTKPRRVYAQPSRPRRPSSSRPRPTSGMPQGEAQTHSLYMEIANLQMTRARQVKIRDALLAQIANCEDEIDLAEARTAALMARIAEIESRADATTERATERRPARRAQSAHDPDDSTRSGMTVDELRSGGTFTFKY